MTAAYRVSPSSLSYGLSGCDRCWAEARNGEKWPERPFPGLFTRLDRQQRAYFEGKSTSVLDPNLPQGVIADGTGVKAAPFEHAGVSLTIRGTLDAIANLEDGRILVVDYKSIVPKEHLGELYWAQLAAYTWALEHPLSGEPRQVAAMGLLLIYPTVMADTDQGPASLLESTWIPVPRDDQAFVDLLRHLAEIAAEPSSAESTPECEWCDLRDRLTI